MIKKTIKKKTSNIKKKGGSNCSTYREGCPAEGCYSTNDTSANSEFLNGWEHLNLGKPILDDIEEMELTDFYNYHMRGLIERDLNETNEISIYNSNFELFGNFSKKELAQKLMEGEPNVFTNETFTMNACEWKKYNSNNDIENNNICTMSKFSDEKEPLGADFKRCKAYFLNNNNDLVEFDQIYDLPTDNTNLENKLSKRFIDFLKENFGKVEVEHKKKLIKDRETELEKNVINSRSSVTKFFKKLSGREGKSKHDKSALHRLKNQNKNLKNKENSLSEFSKLLNSSDNDEYRKMANLYKIFTRQRFGNDMRMGLWPWIYGGAMNSIKYSISKEKKNKKQIIIDEISRSIFVIMPVMEISDMDEMTERGLSDPVEKGIVGYMIWYAVKGEGYKIKHILIDLRPKLVKIMTKLDPKYWYNYETILNLNDNLVEEKIVQELEELSRNIQSSFLQIKQMEENQSQSANNSDKMVMSENEDTFTEKKREINQNLIKMIERFNLLQYFVHEIE